jgi:hypothetical protein
VADNETLNESFRELTHEVMELLISIGIISSVAGRWPEEVQDSWENRISDLRDYARNQTTEAQLFASSYD